MKDPIKKTETVVFHYWDCGIDAHRHRTLDVARRCIVKQEKRKDNSPKWHWKDYLEVIGLIEGEGKTLAEVARMYGKSKSRMGQIYKQGCRYRREFEFVGKDRLREVCESVQHLPMQKRKYGYRLLDAERKGIAYEQAFFDAIQRDWLGAQQIDKKLENATK